MRKSIRTLRMVAFLWYWHWRRLTLQASDLGSRDDTHNIKIKGNNTCTRRIQTAEFQYIPV